MPTTAQERIDRITSHLSASFCRGKVISGAPSSRTTMQNNPRPPVTSHALDTAIGKPAQGLPLKLEQLRGEGKGTWVTLGSSETNNDGRSPSLVAPGSVLEKATYRVTFDTETYFRSTGAPCFYPEVTVVFRIEDPSQHYHIPLLISPFGYSTYRGS